MIASGRRPVAPPASTIGSTGGRTARVPSRSRRRTRSRSATASKDLRLGGGDRFGRAVVRRSRARRQRLLRACAPAAAWLRLRRALFGGRCRCSQRPSAPGCCWGCCCCCCWAPPTFFLRLRRRDLRDGAFGAGRLSASAFGDLPDLAELLAGPVEGVVRARRVPLGGGEQRGADFERQRLRDLDQLRDVLLVPVAARVRDRSEQALGLRELGAGATILNLTGRLGELPRPALENLIGSVRLAFTDRAEQDPRARRAGPCPTAAPG